MLRQKLTKWMINDLEEALQASLSFVIKYPKTVFGSFIITFLILASFAPQVKMLIRVSDMLSSETESHRSNSILSDKFKVYDTLALVINKKSGQTFTISELCAVKTYLQDLNYSDPDLVTIRSIFDLRRATTHKDALYYERYLSPDCVNKNAESIDLITAQSSPLQGILYNDNLSTMLVTIDVRDADTSSRFGRFNPLPIQKYLAELDKAISDFPDVEAYPQGSAGFSHYFLQSLMHDQIINLLIFSIFILVFRMIYGSWRGGILATGSLFIATTMLFGVMGLFSVPLDILSNCLFAIVALSATEDFLHVSSMRAKPGDDWIESFREMILPGFYTSLTTVIGFASLNLSSVDIVSRLGTLAAVGAALKWVCIFLILPSFICIFPKFQLWVKPGTTRFADRLGSIAKLRLSKGMAFIATFIFFIGAYGFTQIRSNDSIREMWPDEHIFSQGIALVSEKIGWENWVNIIYANNVSAEERLDIEHRIKNLDAVHAIESELDITAHMSKKLDPTLAGMVQDEIQTSAYFSRYISEDFTSIRSIAYLKYADFQNVQKFKNTVSGICQDKCFLAGDLESYVSFSENVIYTLITSFLVSLILVSLLQYLLCWALQEPAKFAVVFSSIWGPIVLIGALPFVLGGINFVSCVFAAIFVGLSGDSSIHFLFAKGEEGVEKGLKERQEATVQITFVFITTSLAYLVSDFKQPRTLGLLFCSGYLILMLGDLWILKGLLDLKQFLRRRYESWKIKYG